MADLEKSVGALIRQSRQKVLFFPSSLWSTYLFSQSLSEGFGQVREEQKLNKRKSNKISRGGKIQVRTVTARKSTSKSVIKQV